jgi:glycosyltransferase involved in cell wall biosynthesis
MQLVTVAINNYNYGRFIRDAIDSALAQTYRRTEVVVVDDGSSDESRSIIERYGEAVIPVFKINGGQGSAYNAGFAESRGAFVLFLDADDILLPSAVERAVPLFDADVAKVHWPIRLSDEWGRPTGPVWPRGSLPDGDVRRQACRLGPTNHPSPPASGNIYARWFVEQWLPMPENLYRIAADGLLLETAPFCGRMRSISEPQSLYRQHARGDHSITAVDEKIARGVAFFDHYAPLLVQRCRNLGCDAGLDRWRRQSWWHRYAAALRELRNLETGSVILVDDATWEPGTLADRTVLPLVERDGIDWGPPIDAAHAMAEIERHRAGGTRFLVFVWPCFWYFDVYPTLKTDLTAAFRHVISTEDVVVFDLQLPGRPPNASL